jgi:hypothetical protein
MFESNNHHEYDDRCMCMDCCSHPERIECIRRDAERQHHTIKHRIQEHIPETLLVIAMAVLLFIVLG